MKALTNKCFYLKTVREFIIIMILFFIPFIQLLSQNKNDFKIFNALLYKNTPDLRNYGFSKINMIYEDGVISTNYKFKKGDYNWRYIDFTKIMKEARKTEIKKIPVCLDVEYWGKYLYNKTTKSNAEDIYENLINMYRVIDSKSLISVFHYGAISERIYNASNVVYPCYYTHSTNRNEWISMVKNGINKIKKRNKNLPIYAFIWPQYNPDHSKHDLGYSFIEPDFWKLQLETLYPLKNSCLVSL